MGDNKQRNFDRLSSLPDSLLCKILSELSTKESVSTSVLSKRWRYLWLQVSVFELHSNKFTNHGFEDFLDRFLSPQNSHHVERFKLIYDAYYAHNDNPRFMNWISTVIMRGICHLHVQNYMNQLLQMPIFVYSCDRLVNLRLRGVVLDHPLFVSLPCLKILCLETVKYETDLTLEFLISSCPVLEELTVLRDRHCSLGSVRVHSQSLKRFQTRTGGYKITDFVFEIDASRLEYMNISDYLSKSFIIHDIGLCPKVYISVSLGVPSGQRLDPNDSSKITMIGKFLNALSKVKDMTISSHTLKVIRDYCKIQTLPQFSNLSCLNAHFKQNLWEMLPSFLESFPNLKSLTLELFLLRETKEINLTNVPECLLSSLEFVHIKTKNHRYSEEKGRSSMMKLAKYFLENCAGLKKLRVSRSFHYIINEIKSIPRSSTICEVVME